MIFWPILLIKFKVSVLVPARPCAGSRLVAAHQGAEAALQIGQNLKRRKITKKMSKSTEKIYDEGQHFEKLSKSKNRTKSNTKVEISKDGKNLKNHIKSKTGTKARKIVSKKTDKI